MILNLKENLVFNKEDLVFNINKFESGESNILLITGFPGSGKSTLAADFADRYDCTYISLDYFTDYLFSDTTIEELLEINEDGLVEYIKQNNIPNNQDPEDYNEEKIINAIRDYLRFIIEWCKKQQGQRFIIEGYQLYDVYKAGDTHITNCPMIIKGTSGLVSTWRAAKRNEGSTIKNFNNLIKPIFKDNKNLQAVEKDMLNSKSFAEDFKLYEELWDEVHLTETEERLIDLFWDGIRDYSSDLWFDSSTNEKEEILWQALEQLNEPINKNQAIELFWDWADGLEEDSFIDFN